MATNHNKAKLVVSPGKENEDRDYRYKRSEYAARGIAEYWIVDPERDRVAVLTYKRIVWGSSFLRQRPQAFGTKSCQILVFYPLDPIPMSLDI
jgi:hypothetical protein